MTFALCQGHWEKQGGTKSEKRVRVPGSHEATPGEKLLLRVAALGYSSQLRGPCRIQTRRVFLELGFQGKKGRRPWASLQTQQISLPAGTESQAGPPVSMSSAFPRDGGFLAFAVSDASSDVPALRSYSGKDAETPGVRLVTEGGGRRPPEDMAPLGLWVPPEFRAQGFRPLG